MSVVEAERPEEPQPKRGIWATLAAGGAVVLSKLKFLLIALKGLKFGKLALTSLTMAASIWFYARIWGWSFGVGFVLLILIHELGHGYAIRKNGLAAGWPVFIPFFGAMIALKGAVQSPEVEAEIAYGGPLWGTFASLACAAIYFATGARFWVALAYTGFFLNLFNLLPIRPLDGGRVAQAFSRRAWIVGAVLVGAMFLVGHAPQLLLIGLMALPHIFSRAPQPEMLPADAQRRWATRYFGLCFFLGAASFLSHRLLG